jgi:hypothetical protein
MDAPALEQLLRPENPAIERERAAETSGRWQEYLRESVPPPSRLSFARRSAWQTAYDRALAIGNEREVRGALIFELWFCYNPDDAASHRWSKVVAVSFDNEDYDLVEKTALGSQLVLARVERARRAFTVPSRIYGPRMDLAYRNEHYATVETRTIERVVDVERSLAVGAVPKPTRRVPPFSTDSEPAIVLGGVDSELVDRIRRLVEKIRIFPKQEE